MLFGWKRICSRVTFANYFNFVILWTAHLQFKLLILSYRFDQFSFDLVTCSHFRGSDLIKVRHCMVDYHLDTQMRATVVQFNKGKEIALCTSGSSPSRTFYHMIKILFMIFVESCYSDAPSVGKVWYWLFLYWDISLKFIFDFSFISRVFWTSTIASVSSWFCFRCFWSLKLARTSFPLGFVSLSES